MGVQGRKDLALGAVVPGMVQWAGRDGVTCNTTWEPQWCGTLGPGVLGLGKDYNWLLLWEGLSTGVHLHRRGQN